MKLKTHVFGVNFLASLFGIWNLRKNNSLSMGSSFAPRLSEKTVTRSILVHGLASFLLRTQCTPRGAGWSFQSLEALLCPQVIWQVNPFDKVTFFFFQISHGWFNTSLIFHIAAKTPWFWNFHLVFETSWTSHLKLFSPISVGRFLL